MEAEAGWLMKRKTLIREQAERVVDLYVEVITSNRDEIAWEGRSMSGAIADFLGQIPKPSGFSGFCTLADKADRMRRWRHDHALACDLMNRLSNAQRDAVVIDRTHRGKTKVAIDPFVQDARIEIRWDDAACAEALGCSVPAFQRRVYDGYSSIERMLCVDSAAA